MLEHNHEAETGNTGMSTSTVKDSLFEKRKETEQT